MHKDESFFVIFLTISINAFQSPNNTKFEQEVKKNIFVLIFTACLIIGSCLGANNNNQIYSGQSLY